MFYFLGLKEFCNDVWVYWFLKHNKSDSNIPYSEMLSDLF